MRGSNKWSFRPYTRLHQTSRATVPYICLLSPFCDGFSFEFRNSVEHWYPQHPSENMFSRWTHEEGLDDFGNLCLVQRNENSRFSNSSPEAKKSSFEKMINKGSLKLRLMAEATVGDNGVGANERWKREACALHEKSMIEKILYALNMEI